MTERSQIVRAHATARDMAFDMMGRDKCGVMGFGVFEVHDERGLLVLTRPFANLITDAGDLYIAGMVITGESPAAAAHPTFANGMKLGTGTGSPTKNGTNSALGSYISGSNQVFASTYPQTLNQGAGLGVSAYRRSVWSSAAVFSNIAECAIVNDAGTDATSIAANTYSRTTFTAFTKNTGDTITANYQWLFKGA